MHPYAIKAEVIGFSVPYSSPFKCGGLLFERPRRAQFLNRTGGLSGRVRFYMMAPDWQYALNLSLEGILRSASELLTFCQGSSVYFDRIIIDDGEFSFRCRWWRRTGMPLVGRPRVRRDRTLDFFDRSMRVVTTPDFNTRTRVMESLYWLNETVVSDRISEETRFTLLWLALETLVGADDDCRRSLTLLSKQQFKSLSAAVRQWVDGECEEPVREELLRRLSCVNNPSALQRVTEFCRLHKVPIEDVSFSQAKDVRNIIHHVPWKSVPGLTCSCNQLETLVERCICRVMDLDCQRYLEPTEMP